MITTVNEFCEQISEDIDGIVDILAFETGRGGPQEENAWRKSLPPLSEALHRACEHHAPLGGVHLGLGLGHLALEYRLPAANSWCDAILLGENSRGSAHALIIELKHWETSGDSPGPREALISRREGPELHPSDQVRGYTLYCRNFHSTVLDHKAEVDGCVYFTKPGTIHSYRQPPNDRLVEEFPVYSLYEEQDTRRFSEFIAERFAKGNPEFAESFSHGHYVQDRNILRQVAQSLKGSSARPFVLLDEQRRGFSFCLDAIDRVQRKQDRKSVVIVKGPPGSGKSALAANLWIECAERYHDQGNIVFVTTSSCQSTNWQRTFEVHGRVTGARFLTLTSNNFNPGLTGKMVSDLRKRGHKMDYHDWQECMKAFYAAGNHSRVPDNNHHIAIVDEAHALINPESHDIGFSSGWCVQAGPQAHHIIRASDVTVFLLDDRQSYRDNETTSIDDLKDFASRLGAEVTEISLEGHQFRCGGSVEYLDWLESVLVGQDPVIPVQKWRKKSRNSEGRFLLEIMETPADVDEVLSGLHEAGQTVRLVSSYSVPWITIKDPATGKKWANPHRYRKFIENIRPNQSDFQIQYEVDGEKRVWSRPWNFAPSEDYTYFIQAPDGTPMHANPLNEVGCPYVLRGFDYDYLGVLWLNDLVWRGDRWEVQPDHVHETAIKSTRGALKRAGLSYRERQDAVAKLLDRVMRAHRILLTRAVKGVFVYVDDKETRKHLEDLLTRA